MGYQGNLPRTLPWWGMLLYLVSDLGASATGATMSVDGGWTAT